MQDHVSRSRKGFFQRSAFPFALLLALFGCCFATSDWWFAKGAAFTRDYGRTNPWEDWATSVEAYFSQVYTGEMEAGANLAPAKVKVVDQFLTSKMT